MLLAEAQKDREVELRSPVPGQNPVYDLSGPTIGNYKTLPTSPHGKKLPSPRQTWCTVGAPQFSGGSCCQEVTTQASPARMRVCIPSLAPPFGSLFTGESAEVLLSYLPQYLSNPSTFPSSSCYYPFHEKVGGSLCLGQ